jgi:hypothetical protein
VPIALADTLLRPAEADLYRPVWSERVLDEMVDAVESVHPNLAPGAARRMADVIRSSFEDASVAGWRDLASGLACRTPSRGTVAVRPWRVVVAAGSACQTRTAPV